MHTPINEWTKLKILDHIAKNFTGRSFLTRDRDMSGEVCAYRGDNGNRCAVGIFIPDHLYSIRMENKNVERVLQMYSELHVHMPLGLDAMAELQKIHDSKSTDDTCLNDMIQWVENNVENVS